MALRATLALSFTQNVYAEHFWHFIESLDNTNEFRLAGLTFMDDSSECPVTWYSDTRTLQIHDSTRGANPAEQDLQMWTMGDLTCRFRGDDEIVETAEKVYELAREYFVPVPHPVLPC